MAPLTVLLKACHAGFVPEVLGLIKKEKKKGRLSAFINEEGEDGNTALLAALGGGHLKVAEILVQKGGASVDQANKNGATPLSISSSNGHEEQMKLLLANLQRREC